MRRNQVVFDAISTTCLPLLLLLFTIVVFLFSPTRAAASSATQHDVANAASRETAVYTPGPWAAPTTRIQIKIPTREIRFLRLAPQRRELGRPNSTLAHARLSLAHGSHDSRASAEEGRPHPSPPDCHQRERLPAADGAFPRKSRRQRRGPAWAVWAACAVLVGPGA